MYPPTRAPYAQLGICLSAACFNHIRVVVDLAANCSPAHVLTTFSSPSIPSQFAHSLFFRLFVTLHRNQNSSTWSKRGPDAMFKWEKSQNRRTVDSLSIFPIVKWKGQHGATIKSTTQVIAFELWWNSIDFKPCMSEHQMPQFKAYCYYLLDLCVITPPDHTSQGALKCCRVHIFQIV